MIRHQLYFVGIVGVFSLTSVLILLRGPVPDDPPLYVAEVQVTNFSGGVKPNEYKQSNSVPWLWAPTKWAGPLYHGKFVHLVPDDDERYRLQIEYASNISQVHLQSPIKVKVVYIKNKILKNFEKVLISEAEMNCPKVPCQFTVDETLRKTADAMLHVPVWKWAPKEFQDPLPTSPHVNQTLILMSQEPPAKLLLREGSSSSNFQTEILATYRRDSDLFTPFWIWRRFNNSYRELRQRRVSNYARGKTRLAVAIISNCNTKNNRMAYIVELMKYIPVDVYGFCGFLKLNKAPFHTWQHKLYQYKFYLAFENSNCREYVSEKFYHSLMSKVVPVVLGAHPDDYNRIAPSNSYIHVEDFKSPKALAQYLLHLDRNNEAYDSYFSWIGTGRLEKWKEHFLCRACAMIHYNDILPKPADDVQNWWSSYDGNFPCLSKHRWYWLRDGNETKLKGVWFTNGTSLLGKYRLIYVKN